MDDSLLNVAGPIVALLALLYCFADDLRFLWQGRWFRRLDAATQAKLALQNPEWYESHARRLPRSQWVAGILTAITVLAWLVWSRLNR